MLSYQKGDAAAFAVLFDRHAKGIYNFLYRFLGQRENVEEAFQEVFIRVIKASANYVPTAKFSTWAYTIARNYCVDCSRKGRYRKTVSLDEKLEHGEAMTLGDKIPDDAARTENQVSAQNLEAKLQEALDQINPDQKEVFLLREKSNLPFDEIANIVGSSVNTVKSRMRYALLALQEVFKKLGISDG